MTSFYTLADCEHHEWLDMMLIDEEYHKGFMPKNLRDRIFHLIIAVFGFVILLAAVAFVFVVTLWDRPRRDQFWHRLTKSRRSERLTISGIGDNGSQSDDGLLLRSVAKQHREHVNAVAAEVNEWRTMQSEVRAQVQVLSAAVRKIQNEPNRPPSLMKVD
jgi:uncharacterized membrane protein YdfJ with MMPL/SSD domain